MFMGKKMLYLKLVIWKSVESMHSNQKEIEYEMLFMSFINVSRLDVIRIKYSFRPYAVGGSGRLGNKCMK